MQKQRRAGIQFHAVKSYQRMHAIYIYNHGCILHIYYNGIKWIRRVWHIDDYQQKQMIVENSVIINDYALCCFLDGRISLRHYSHSVIYNNSIAKNFI